jgi:hypothetical protein
MKAALEFLTQRTVALVAMIGQYGADFLFEKLDAFRSRGALGLEFGKRERNQKTTK